MGFFIKYKIEGKFSLLENQIELVYSNNSPLPPYNGGYQVPIDTTVQTGSYFPGTRKIKIFINYEDEKLKMYYGSPLFLLPTIVHEVFHASSYISFSARKKVANKELLTFLYLSRCGVKSYSLSRKDTYFTELNEAITHKLTIEFMKLYKNKLYKMIFQDRKDWLLRENVLGFKYISTKYEENEVNECLKEAYDDTLIEYIDSRAANIPMQKLDAIITQITSIKGLKSSTVWNMFKKAYFTGDVSYIKMIASVLCKTAPKEIAKDNFLKIN